MLVWGLAQLAGAVMLLCQPVLPHPGVFLLTFPFFLAALVSRRKRWLSALWLGAVLAAWQADRNLDDRLAAELDGRVVEVSGQILGLIEDDGRRRRFRFRIDAGAFKGDPVPLPREVRLNLYDPLDIATGERWRWRVKLRRPRGFANPGTFDYERWLFAEGIGATGYVRDTGQAERLDAAFGEWRAAIAARMAQVSHGPAAGLLRGLATGDRDGVTIEQWELLRKTGTVHLMAISGLHIALVSGLVFALAAFIRRRWQPAMPLFLPALVAALAAILYGGLAGFGLSVQRALIAGSTVLAALALRRHLAPSHAFGAALVATLCLDPLAPLGVGFWLSFGAVAAILFTVSGRRPAPSRVVQALRVQAGLFVLMLPLIQLSFGRVPLLSPFANLVAIPVFDGLVVPCVLLALLLLPWPGLADALLSIPAWVLERLLELLAIIAAVDPGVALPDMPVWVMTLAMAGLALVCAPRAWPGRLFAPWLLLPWLFSLGGFTWLPTPSLVVHFLDVGQGLAVVVETPSRTLVYDTGPGFGARDAADLVVIPFLESRGREPDIVMVSHGDNDHAGGLASLQRRFPDARVLGDAQQLEEDVAVVTSCSGQHWQWDGTDFSVLHPSVPDMARSDNDASCVLRIEHQGMRFLLTGDIETAAEARLVKEKAGMLDAEVALVPHHGSRTSSTSRFVERVRPLFAIVAAGYGNQWGFPKPDVVERWEAGGAVVLVTGEQGAISLGVQGDSLCAESFRDHWRLWRERAPAPRPVCRRFDDARK